MRNRKLAALALVAVLVGALVSTTSMHASADTLTVTRTDDPAPDGCRPLDCSLREAVIASNNRPGPDVIVLKAKRYNLMIPGVDEDAGSTGDLDIHKNVAIRGAGPRQTVIHANGLDRVIEVGESTIVGLEPPGDVTLTKLSIKGGLENGLTHGGGGVLNWGGLELRRTRVIRNEAHCCGGGVGTLSNGTTSLEKSFVAGNVANNGYGGAVHNDAGSLSVEGSTIEDNTTLEYGGGIYSLGKTVVKNSLILSNETTAGCCGGGLYLQGFGKINNTEVRGNHQTGSFDPGGGGMILFAETDGKPFVMKNSTVSDNTAGRDGGGIYAKGPGGFRMINSTLSGNESIGAIGGGFYEISDGPVSLLYSTIAFNESAGPGGGIGMNGGVTGEGLIVSNNSMDCNGTLTGAVGANLDSDNFCFTEPEALHGGARLRPLDDNGGSTPTHALRPTSDAIDAALKGDCPSPNRDQRGVKRPQNGDGTGGARCDLGSFEREP
jgi:predicted outer membrane repeat protein